MKPTLDPKLKLLLQLLLVAALYVAGGCLARETTLLVGKSPLLWSPAGLGLAVIIMFGWRWWPAVVVGSLLFAWLEKAPITFCTLGIIIGNTLGALGCALLLPRLMRSRHYFDWSRDAIVYLAVISGVGATLNAVCIQAGLLLDQQFSLHGLAPSFLKWWVPNALAMLLITPAIIAWASPTPVRMTFWRGVEAGACGALLLCSLAVSLHDWFVHGPAYYPLAYLPIFFLFWFAIRFGVRGGSLAVLVTATFALMALLTGQGPFVLDDLHHSLELAGYSFAAVGGSVFLLATAADERRRVFQEAINNEKRLRLVLSDQTDLVCRFLADGQITFVNHAYCLFYAKTEAELLGTNFFTHLSAGETKALREKIGHPDEWPASWVFDRRGAGADDHIEWQQYTIRRILRAGTHDYEYQAVIQNITARKQAELALETAKVSLEQMNIKLQMAVDDARAAANQANRANQAKSEFLANMSHEIRTPLSGILGMIELLSQTRLDFRQKEFTVAATESAHALLHVINDVLDFSKIEAGKMAMAREDFSLRKIVDSVLENAATRDPNKSISLAAIVNREVPQQVTGDPARLRQVLLNLVNNAVKFTEHGEVVVRVFPANRTEDRIRLRFEVTDTGIGLTDEQTEKLFQPFVQADTSSSRKFGGTGLGLAISRKIVELMGGRIGVRSSPGQGSTFWFETPFEVPARPMVERSFPGFVFTQVLVASPRASLREALMEQLSNWGVPGREVATFENLSHILQAELQASLMPMLLCDDEMFAKNGAELRRLLNDFKGRMEALLLAGPSAAFEEPDMVLFNTVLIKPVREQALFDALVSVLAGKRPDALRPVRVPGDTNLIRRDSLDPKRTPVSGLRILAAEDHPFNRKLCQLMLDTFGARADWAVNGREAVEKFKPGRYDAIIMDCNMPEMDGHEATAAIRHIELEHKIEKPVRIIALTANALAGEREKCLAAGMDDYLSKPFTSQQLYQALLAVVPPAVETAPVASPEFDATRLEVLIQDVGRAAAVEMAGDFLHELPDRITECRRLQASGQWPDLRRAAHSIKGLFVLFGFQPLSETFHTLEAAASAADAARSGDLLKQLDIAVIVAQTHLNEWLEAQRERVGE